MERKEAACKKIENDCAAHCPQARASMRRSVSVPRAVPGDLVQATHTGLGRHWAQLTAHVAAAGEVPVGCLGSGRIVASEIEAPTMSHC